MRSNWLTFLILALLVLPLGLFIGCDTGTGDDGDGDGDGDGDDPPSERTLEWGLYHTMQVAEDLFADPIVLAAGANDLGDDGILRNNLGDTESRWFVYYGENGDPDESEYMIWVYYDGSTDYFNQDFPPVELPDYTDAKPWLDAANGEFGGSHAYIALKVYPDQADVFPNADNVAKCTFFDSGDAELGDVYVDADDYEILD